MTDYNLILPRELPEAATASTNGAIPLDNGSAVVKVTPKKVVDAGRPFASQSQAEAGTDATVAMSPLTTRQAIEAVVPAVVTTYVEQAEAWAESPTAPDPMYPDSKSAKTWADNAREIAERIDLGALDAAVAQTEADAVLTSADREAVAIAREDTLLARADAWIAADEAISAAEYLSSVAEVGYTPVGTLDVDGGAVSWVPPASVGKMWQDSARTTLVTGAGQQVGAMALVGFENDQVFATQTTNANRPYIGRYPEGGVRNTMTNSALLGAVVGNPGTPPTGWGVSNATREVVAVGTDAYGMPYVDIRMYGAATAAAILQLDVNTGAKVIAAEDNTWSTKVSVVGGDDSNITYACLQVSWRDAAGAALSIARDEVVNFKDQATHGVVSFTSLAPSNAAYAIPQIRINASGAFDITFRVSGPQVEAGVVRTGWQGTAHSGYDVTEAGKGDIWYLARPSSGVALNIGLAASYTNATIGRGIDGGSYLDVGQTLSSGNINILGDVGERTTAFYLALNPVRQYEYEAVLSWLNRSAGDYSVNKTFDGAVSLFDIGCLPTDGDVRDMIEAASLRSRTRHVIIPYHDLPWRSFGQLILDGITLEWDYGAKLAQDHAQIYGVRLRNGGRLIRPYITSTLYAAQSMSEVPEADRATGYSHWKRGILMESDNSEILDVQMLEYIAGGILGEGVRGCKVTNLTARYLRSYEGYAAAIDLKGGANNYVTVNTITDSDRGIEPEDGETSTVFVAAPGIMERLCSEYYLTPGRPIAQSGGFFPHSHVGYEAVKNIRFEGHWTFIDCTNPIYFDEATADPSDYNQNIYVEHATIINTDALNVAEMRRSQVYISGTGHDVTVSFVNLRTAGVASYANVDVINGGYNDIKVVGPDVQAYVPWVNVSKSAPNCTISVDATDLSVQPPSGANAAAPHLIDCVAANTIVRLNIAGVQNRGYVKFGDGTDHAEGSVVLDPIITAPAINAPAAAVRLANANDVTVQGGRFSDPSNAMQMLRIVTGTGNVMTGVTCYKQSGAVVAMDGSASNNVIAYNRIGAATILDVGAGNVKTGNY